MAYKVGFIGVGNMGGALVRSIARNDRDKDFSLYAFDINTPLLKELADELGIREEDSAKSLVSNSDIVVLAVKPQYCDHVLEYIKPVLQPEKILVSVAVGLSMKYYKNILGEKAKVVRTMPNTPALVGAGMTLVSWDDLITDDEKKMVMKLLGFSGRVEELDENLMSEVTALTGSSPAYVFILIEAMADAAVKLGIQRSQAYRLAAQAVLGSAKMVLDTGKHPGELKDMVCSPAGTTIEAVMALEREGFRSAVMTAMEECARRAREIGKHI